MTLGAHEVDDLQAVVDHVRQKYPECIIGLWGRSMGAVTALLYGQRDPSIAGMVRHQSTQTQSISLCMPAIHHEVCTATSMVVQWVLVTCSSSNVGAIMQDAMSDRQ